MWRKVVFIDIVCCVINFISVRILKGPNPSLYSHLVYGGNLKLWNLEMNWFLYEKLQATNAPVLHLSRIQYFRFLLVSLSQDLTRRSCTLLDANHPRRFFRVTILPTIASDSREQGTFYIRYLFKNLILLFVGYLNFNWKGDWLLMIHTIRGLEEVSCLLLERNFVKVCKSPSMPLLRLNFLFTHYTSVKIQCE